MKKNLLTFSVLLLTAFAFVAFNSQEASAQRRGRANRNAKADVDRLIRNVEERVDRFVAQFNDTLDRSRLDGTKREDNLNQRARDLESATDELRREFDRNDSWAENKDEVRKCLNIASDIDATMRARRFSAATETNWVNVRNELNALAKVYGLPRIGKAYR